MAPGFGNQPQSFSLLVTITGHSSPRWKGASDTAEADRRNQVLSNQRALTTKTAVEQLLRSRLGQNINIEFNLSYANDRVPKHVGIGSYGVGSRQSLEQAKGNRNSDEEKYRKVEVAIEFITTKYHTVGKSVPLNTVPAYTKFWYVTIKSLLISGLVIPGPVWGFIDVAIKNSLSGKEAIYTAPLWGGGDPMPSDTPDKNVGRKEASIVTDEPLGLDDFNGTFIRLERLDAQVIFGFNRLYMGFPLLGKHTWNFMEQKWGFGFPGGFIVSGYLQMKGKNPGDWWKPDETYTESYVTQIHGRKAEAIEITFPTESAELTAKGREKLVKFVEKWRERLGT